MAHEFTRLRDSYGGPALAAFCCGRSTNEDIYLTQKFARACLQTNNVDNCARVCHSASVAGLAMTLGSGAMTNPMPISPTMWTRFCWSDRTSKRLTPIIAMQIRQAVARGTKLIVVDSRELGLAKQADIHLSLKPGTSVAFANGMLHVIVEEGLVDQQFIDERTESFEVVKRAVADYAPKKVAQICGIDPNQLREAARIYGRAKKAPIIYCLGVTEHSTGTEGVMSLSNLAMATGKLGRPGCGINPLRGQNNVQDACDMSANPTDFPGYQKLSVNGTVEKFEKAWNIELSSEPGITSSEVIEEALKGNTKGIFSYGEDPTVTDPDSNMVSQAIDNLEFLVVDELFMTSTAARADVVLPELNYPEKDGTFTDTERRVQRVLTNAALDETECRHA